MNIIDKDSLTIELERRLDELYELLPDASKVENGTITISEACDTGKYTALESFKNYIDSLEMKEVDLNREMQAFALLYLEPLKISDSNIGISITMAQLYRCAEHFLELGIKVAQKEK